MEILLFRMKLEKLSSAADHCCPTPASASHRRPLCHPLFRHQSVSSHTKKNLHLLSTTMNFKYRKIMTPCSPTPKETPVHRVMKTPQLESTPVLLVDRGALCISEIKIMNK